MTINTVQILFPKAGAAGFSVEKYTFWILVYLFYSQTVKRKKAK